MASGKRRVGIVGFGKIGHYVYEELLRHPETGIEVAFVHDMVSERVAGLPDEIILEDLGEFASRDVDMVCEFAHPDVSRKWGETFLQVADYLPLSATVFADAAMEESLRKAALDNGKRLWLAHGGVIGLESIIEGRDVWEEVTFTMTKNPKNVDFLVSDIDPEIVAETGYTTVYDGPTRGICPKFPRNVNTHATTALAGIGFDRTRSKLVLNRALDRAIVEIHCQGEGIDLLLRRSDPIEGVTGIATLQSVYSSVCSTAEGGPGTHFC